MKYRKYVAKEDANEWGVYQIITPIFRNGRDMDEKFICGSNHDWPEISFLNEHHHEIYDITNITKEEVDNLKVAAL